MLSRGDGGTTEGEMFSGACQCVKDGVAGEIQWTDRELPVNTGSPIYVQDAYITPRSSGILVGSMVLSVCTQHCPWEEQRETHIGAVIFISISTL